MSDTPESANLAARVAVLEQVMHALTPFVAAIQELMPNQLAFAQATHETLAAGRTEATALRHALLTACQAIMLHHTRLTQAEQAIQRLVLQ